MKLKKLVPAAMLTFLLASGLTACGNNNNDENTLNIVCIDAGYGEEWINEIANKFQQSHEGVKVNVTAIYESESLISQHLSSKNNNDDLYISVGSNWKYNAASGMFAELDDLLEDTVDGVKVKDKVSDEYKNSIYFTKSNGDKKCYRLPFVSAIGGIFYNAKMFEDNGWQIPTTYQELVQLCQTINSAKVVVAGDPDGTTTVKPFIYTGTNTDYFDYTVFDWWGQLVGKDKIQEFLKYESADNFDVTKNETYNALKTATSKWQNLFDSKNSFYVPDTNNMSAGTAQKQFINGYAAMMFNGDWLYNESLRYTNGGTFDSTFKLGLMKTPVLEEAKAEYANTSYIIGEDQYIAIPKTSKRQTLAKEFIKAIISNDGCQTFTEKAHAFLAYNSDIETTQDEFLNSVLDLKSQYTTRFTNYSSNRKYLCNYIDIWATGSNRPFSSLLSGVSTLDSAFNNIASTVKANWAEWTKKSS